MYLFCVAQNQSNVTDTDNDDQLSLSKEVAELVGLWLAEGDNKSIREITITNNCIELIQFSYRVLNRLFNRAKFRLYVYLSKDHSKDIPGLPKVAVTKYYSDVRARRPYFILRIASTELNRDWKRIVEVICSQEHLSDDILRGFFAGEGNIKFGSHHNRAIRIAQKEPKKVISAILDRLGIEWRFSIKERAYVIVGRSNWEKAAKIRIADLHPEKKKKFYEIYEQYRQWHYKKHHIKNNILKHLFEPKTSNELAKIYCREVSRIQEILTKLKRDGKITSFRVLSKNYWIDNRAKVILISVRKKRILDLLDKPRRVFEIAKALSIDDKCVVRRLIELKTLGLVNREDYYWHKIKTDNEVRVCE